MVKNHQKSSLLCGNHSSTPLCRCDEIEDPGSKAFSIETRGNEGETDIFVIHKNGQFYAYINSCPHTGASLNWQQDQFLDMDKAYIQCSTHDALFDIETGLCISGPCVGDCLTKIEISIDTAGDTGS